MDVTGRTIADRRDAPVEADESPFGPSRVGLTIGLLLTVSFVAFETLAVANLIRKRRLGRRIAGLRHALRADALPALRQRAM